MRVVRDDHHLFHERVRWEQYEAGKAIRESTIARGLGRSAHELLHAETSAVYWTAEAAECRVTFDGSDPTTTNGHNIAAGSSGTWSVAAATAAKFIRTTGVSAIIHASQMR